MTDPSAEYLRATLAELRNLKRLADRALAQVGDAGFVHALDPESNSLAVAVKHVTGNLSSRWTDFLTADGEKPDRNRDGEFELGPADTRPALTQAWEEGWRRCLEGIEALTPGDLGAGVHIRGEAMSAQAAIQRGLAHTAQHVGQIVFLSKHLAGSRWSTLSIPRGQSRSFIQEPAQRDRPREP